MASQLYGTTGRKILPNTVAQINAQTPYLPALYRQRAEDALTKRGLDLQEKSINTNLELGQEQLEQQKKQARLANLLGIGNLGVKAGLGAYQASEPVKTAVDKGISNLSGLLSGGASNIADNASNLGPLQSSYQGAGNLAEWLGQGATSGFDMLTKGVSEVTPKIADYLYGGVGGTTSDIVSSISGSGTPYADYITETMDYLGSLF